MATDALDIGTRRELFVDDFLIEEMTDVTQQLNRPQVQEKAIVWDKPWEGARAGYATVCSHGGTHFMYYRGWPWKDVHDHSNREASVQVTCVATSNDGIHWEKPELGQYEVLGTRDNNVILDDEVYSHNFSPFVDARPGVPESERFKALAGTPTMYQTRPYPGHDLCVGAFTSADGLNWQRMGEGPVMREEHWPRASDRAPIPIFWSFLEGCYVAYFRLRTGPEELKTHELLRWLGRSTSKDFVNWSKVEPIDYDMRYTDEEIQYGAALEQLYTLQATPYFRAPHIYVAFPNRYIADRRVLSGEELHELEMGDIHRPMSSLSIHDSVFMSSRDGRTFDLTTKDAFVRPGLDRRNWGDRSCYMTNGIVQTAPNELSLYYSQHWATRSDPCTAHMVRATLRLDGFMSIKAPYTGGTLVTKPFLFDGDALEINYATSAAGCIDVEIQDAEGNALQEFSLAGNDRVIGDEIDRVVTWCGNPDVSSLAGRPVRLRFALKDAELFSFRFGKLQD